MAARPQSSSSFLGDIRSIAPDSLSDSFNSAPPYTQKWVNQKRQNLKYFPARFMLCHSSPIPPCMCYKIHIFLEIILA